MQKSRSISGVLVHDDRRGQWLVAKGDELTPLAQVLSDFEFSEVRIVVTYLRDSIPEA